MDRGLGQPPDQVSRRKTSAPIAIRLTSRRAAITSQRPGWESCPRPASAERKGSKRTSTSVGGSGKGVRAPVGEGNAAPVETGASTARGLGEPWAASISRSRHPRCSASRARWRRVPSAGHRIPSQCRGGAWIGQKKRRARARRLKDSMEGCLRPWGRPRRGCGPCRRSPRRR